MADFKKTTLDELIADLQARRAAGVPGNTAVAVEGLDNNGKAGFANFELMPRRVSVAKAEFDKNWSICKVVSRGGVDVLMLGVR